MASATVAPMNGQTLAKVLPRLALFLALRSAPPPFKCRWILWSMLRPPELKVHRNTIFPILRPIYLARSYSALREAVANLYNHTYREGKTSQYTYENVCIVPGGRSGLSRVAAVIGDVYTVSITTYFIVVVVYMKVELPSTGLHGL